ncbi:MAG: dihydrodipicolinate synthase family protein [Rhizobiaceae bacterium]
MPLFSGLSAFPITPADCDGQIDETAFAELLELLADASVHSVGLLGSTGGYAYLTREQRRRAVSVARNTLGGRIPVIVSVGALRTDEAQKLARDAGAEGADGLLLAPVSYTPLTQEEAYRHYVAVASATELPLCIYNNPGTTNFNFSVELLDRLAQQPTIKAVKMPLPPDRDFASELARLKANAPDDFAVGYSGDWGCGDALLAGADGWFSVIGGLLPKPSMELARAAMAGDKDEVARINACFQPLWELFQQFGSLRVVYAAMNILELSQAQPHLPLQPLAPEQMARVAAALDRANSSSVAPNS